MDEVMAHNWIDNASMTFFQGAINLETWRLRAHEHYTFIPPPHQEGSLGWSSELCPLFPVLNFPVGTLLSRPSCWNCDTEGS